MSGEAVATLDEAKANNGSKAKADNFIRTALDKAKRFLDEQEGPPESQLEPDTPTPGTEEQRFQDYDGALINIQIALEKAVEKRDVEIKNLKETVTKNTSYINWLIAKLDSKSYEINELKARLEYGSAERQVDDTKTRISETVDDRIGLFSENQTVDSEKQRGCNTNQIGEMAGRRSSIKKNLEVDNHVESIPGEAEGRVKSVSDRIFARIDSVPVIDPEKQVTELIGKIRSLQEEISDLKKKNELLVCQNQSLHRQLDKERRHKEKYRRATHEYRDRWTHERDARSMSNEVADTCAALVVLESGSSGREQPNYKASTAMEPAKQRQADELSDLDYQLEAEVAEMVAARRPPIDVDSGEPMYYANRPDRKIKPIEFLQTTYGRWLQPGREALYQDQLRKIDERLMSALNDFAVYHGLKLKDYVPPKSLRMDRVIEHSRSSGVMREARRLLALSANRRKKQNTAE